MNETETNNQELEKGTENKTYSQEEVDKLIQSTADKRVSQALTKKEKEFAEAKKLLKMTDDEKAEYIKSQYEVELQVKEKDLSLRENKLACVEILSDKGIPTSFAELVLSDNAEDMNKKINILEKEFKKAIAEAVKAKLSGNTPKVATGATTGEMTKEQFQKMNIAQRTQLFNTNPELFRTFSK